MPQKNGPISKKGEYRQCRVHSFRHFEGPGCLQLGCLFIKRKGPLLESPDSGDRSILGSILGVPCVLM